MWEVLVDDEVEMEAAAFVHSFVRLDGQGEIKNVVRVGK